MWDLDLRLCSSSCSSCFNTIETQFGLFSSENSTLRKSPICKKKVTVEKWQSAVHPYPVKIKKCVALDTVIKKLEKYVFLFRHLKIIKELFIHDHHTFLKEEMLNFQNTVKKSTISCPTACTNRKCISSDQVNCSLLTDTENENRRTPFQVLIIVCVKTFCVFFFFLSELSIFLSWQILSSI